MIQSLIAKSEFVGLENVTHLAAGGETPMLKSHRQAIDQFMIDKSCGEKARTLEADMVELARGKCARLFSVNAEEITFLSNASEGINNVAYGLDWHKGDNVVVADVEFPSGILPWTRLENLGVEVRIVRHKNWFIDITDIITELISILSPAVAYPIPIRSICKLICWARFNKFLRETFWLTEELKE